MTGLLAGQLGGQGVVVTGAGAGIGAALAARAVAEGARVVVNDIDRAACEQVALEIGAVPLAGDAASPDGAAELVAAAWGELGGVDVFFANAGIDRGAGLETPDEVWDEVLEVNVLAHVRAARSLVPRWLERAQGDAAAPLDVPRDPAAPPVGRFVVTASAAGLLTMLGAAPYSVSKHGAVAFAEWLAATYAHRGVAVHAVCPQGVETRMLWEAGPLAEILTRDSALTPEQVADATFAAIAEERFLVLPHPEVAAYDRARAADHDRWLRGMNKLQQQLETRTAADHVPD